MWKCRVHVEAAFRALGTAACVTFTCWAASSITSECYHTEREMFMFALNYQMNINRGIRRLMRVCWALCINYENKEKSHLYAGTKYILVFFFIKAGKQFIIFFSNMGQKTLSFFSLQINLFCVRAHSGYNGQPEGFVGWFSCFFLLSEGFLLSSAQWVVAESGGS